jgi:hypothetical protein
MHLVVLHHDKAKSPAKSPCCIWNSSAHCQRRRKAASCFFGVASDIGEHGCSKVLAALCALCDAHNRYIVSAIVSCSRNRYGWAADHLCHMPLTAPVCTPKTSCSIWCCRTTCSLHRKAYSVVFNRLMIIGLGVLAELLCRSCCAPWCARKGAHLHRKVAVQCVF